MIAKADEKKLVEWLNTLIVMAQWDKSLPVYLARLFEKQDQYQQALQLIRTAPAKGSLPDPPGDALNKEEWRRLYEVTTNAESLRRLFAEEKDPFAGANVDQISTLADVSDLTTDPDTMFYSRNGTFHLVLGAIRQRSELNTAELIAEGLNKFYSLLDTSLTVAEQLYLLACSNDWYPVLASLYDARDYTADESETARQSLQEWNRSLTEKLREILLRPTRLYRVPRKLIKLAWEQRDVFTEALNSIPADQRLTGVDLQRQVANIAYSTLAEKEAAELAEIEADLQLLAVVARHYISVRKFAKLDGLVYAWPKIARLGMENYANLEYVEDLLIEKKPRPSKEELDVREARELYELCENNGALIRFLRIHPHFREIDEDELRRYRPLAPVTISDPVQPAQAPIIPPPVPIIPGAVVQPSVTSPMRICELEIATVGTTPGDVVNTEVEYRIVLTFGGKVERRSIIFSLRKLFDQILATIGVTSEESLQSVVKGLFSGTGAEQILARGGHHLLNTMISRAGLDEAIASAFKGDGPIRLVIASELEEIQYLPWEWLPRPGYSELLLADPRFSLVRARSRTSAFSLVPFTSPIRIMGLFPNSPVGARDIPESSLKALDVLVLEGAQYQSLVRQEATAIRVDNELDRIHPHILHFEGYVNFVEINSTVAILFSSLAATSTEPVDLTRFETMLLSGKVQLMVAGRNESNRTFGNAAPIVSHRLIERAVPAVIAPIRGVDEVTATSLTTEFYRAFLAGNTLEHALYTARRKVASRGGDWTSFALFAYPNALDFFQPLPPTA